MRRTGRVWSPLAGSIASIAASSIVLAGDATTQMRANADSLQTWLSSNAVEVRSVDADDENFDDLEPLIDAIGSARVVQLGEPSHGSGTSFAAKVRLTKFLHQRMGFDVLIWESGFYGLRFVEAAMRAADDAATAARRGIYPIWSMAEEVKPLFEYVKASHSTTRPLEMAGFDMAFSPSARFSAELRTFVGSLRDPHLRRDCQDLVDRMLASYAHIACCELNDARTRKYSELEQSGKTGKPLEDAMVVWEAQEGSKLTADKGDLKALNEVTDALLKAVQMNRAAFDQVHGPSETSFMERVIDNMRNDGAGRFDIDEGVSDYPPATFRGSERFFNRRDAQNALNLRWLLDAGYPGRKVIIWAHNAHVMNAYFSARFSSVHVESQPKGLKPTGTYVAEWFGDDVYTIALTAFQGKDGWVTSELVAPIPPALEGSLEERLHALSKPYLFLNIRALDNDPEHPLRKPQSMRVSVPVQNKKKSGSHVLSDVTRVFDGVFYMDQTTSVTRVRGSQ